ncbi:DUF5615 family PIN-like protein [Acidipropionibacterium virtanenii]|uniref:DUF5615 domain-containing protein n=1 Tax=Acidipropionibacterium virtanenii TaxID=2057246 RepID=A0A344UW67_9ACTN|nr:DUF5615 family PIN-like protein [Acidipropionibacterium virtanenii]AXE39515.1 hypothetical protein JS278_02374 [Acidipropionibacterium virtanenii]
MKLLLDQNLSPTICVHLTEAGIESVHVRQIGLRDAPDEAILDHARREGLVVVSQDSDFTNLLAYQAASKPSLILLRIPDAVTAAEVAAVLIGNLSAMATLLEDGAIASLTQDRIRVRRLPLR